MQKLLLALALVVSFAAKASALETALQGDWKVAGTDASGDYTGTATIARSDDGHYTIGLTLDRKGGTSSKAYFLGTSSGTALDGDRGEPNGITGALSGAPKNSVPAHYALSDDGTTLTGKFGAGHETLTRTLGGTAKIVILHTNDVHGQVLPLKTATGQVRGGYAALVARLRKERAAALASGADVLTLDAGDVYAGTPEGDETHGIVDVDAMNLVGFDAMAVGNHEFDQGVPVVKDLCARAKFPVLSANLIDTNTNKLPAWQNLSASTRLNVSGVKVCIIGLLTSSLKQVTTTEGSAGVDALDEATAARRELDANTDAQVTILVDHVGSQGDQQLAQAFGERVAAIVGGHDHLAIQNPQRFPAGKGALVAQAGKSGQWLGRIDIEVDRATGKVVSVSGQLFPVSPSEGEAADIAASIKTDSGAVTAEYDAKVGALTAALPRSGSGSTPLGDFLTDALRNHAKVDAALYNKTGIRGELPKGDVHLRDVYQVAPFADHNIIMTLKGSDLLAVLEGSLAPQIGSPPALEVSGILVHYDSSRPAGHRVLSVTVGGKTLDPKGSYKIVTTKFLSEGGDGHTAFTKGTNMTDEGVTLFDSLKSVFHGQTIQVGKAEARWISGP